MNFKKTNAILFYLFFSILSSFGQNNSFFKAVDACAKTGELIILKDKVVSVEYGRSGQVYLNFGKPFPHQDFAIVIFKETLEEFKKINPLILQDREIKVKGEVSEYQGNCQMIIKTEEQFIIEK